MPWFKVDDNLAFHTKSLRAGNAAMGLWVRAGSWSAQQLTDGFIPDELVGQLGDRRQAGALVRAGLWHQEDGGFRFHEWDERQPLRRAVEDKRKKTAERVRQWRENHRETGE